MSGATTIRLIEAYNQLATPVRFLMGFFRSPQQNFHDTEEVEIDVQRSGEEIAVVVQDLNTGYRQNVQDLYVNKGFKPPVFSESGPIKVHDLMKRVPGQNPFMTPDFQANAITRAFDIFRKLEEKIRRTMELMAAQVLQTGTITLIDNNGVALYTLDFQPKSSHFPTASVPWISGSATPMADIKTLAEQIRIDGLSDPDTLIFGENAFEFFIEDAQVQQRLGKDQVRISMGEVVPSVRGQGATYMGTIWINSYRFDMWTYKGRYNHPQTSVSTLYLDPDKIIVMDSNARLDATFGGVPMLVPPDARVLPYLPGRISNQSGSVDIFSNAWIEPNGKVLNIGADSRPLMVPTAIDRFGCLDTQASGT